MKNLIILALLYIIPLTFLSQIDSLGTIPSMDTTMTNPTDTTVIEFGNTKVLILSEVDNKTEWDYTDTIDCSKPEIASKEELTHWAGIDLGVNGYFFGTDFETSAGSNEHLEIDYGRSRSIAFNVFEPKLRIIKDYVGVFTGLGLEYNNYVFKNDYTLLSSKDSTFAFMDSTIKIKKNKLRTTWLNVPLMLEINTSKYQDKNFHVAAGVIGSWRIGTRYKQKYTSDGDREKFKSSKSFNMEDYRLQASARIGYGNHITLFANYSLTALFEDNKAPEVYPFTVGINLINF